MCVGELFCTFSWCLCISTQTRTLSCASLLVAPACKNDKHGQAWLVDATGAYPVRALCIGGGAIHDGKLIADAVNLKLMEQDWTSMSTDQALEALLGIFSGSEVQDDNSHPIRLVPKNTRLEVAVLLGPVVTRRKLSALPFVKTRR